ncbi:hypothetical protein EH223_07985 [candidate division KSB1 bacterium]|nr:hypothetical protein [candidate division KSB1 bacterium]RQW04132.1 MAG: hypothetical protein EH223_07985 [candidate division KSB1 bacterium]
MNIKAKSFFYFLFLVCLSIFNQAHTADVMYVTFKADTSQQKLIENVCDFYGLNLRYFILDETDELLPALRHCSPMSLILSQSAIDASTREQVDDIVLFAAAENIKILLWNLESKNAPGLSFWSDGLVNGIRSVGQMLPEYTLRFCEDKETNGELSGQQAPFEFFSNYSMNCLNVSDSQRFNLLAQLDSPEKSHPLFGYATVKGANIFLQARIQPDSLSAVKVYRRLAELNRAWQILPLLIYLRYSCGEFCWHRPYDVANLTIDDPWLTEPYGALSFRGLLDEMKSCRFFTTIAYIPWNYDRYEQDMVDLFQENRDFYSICYHGNNHDHREFDRYADAEKGIAGKTLAQHDSLIQQAWARMALFSQSTGLSVEPVFVFPHGIAPQQTLRALKKNNFWATSNYGHVPRGEIKPDDLVFWLRSVTLKYSGFPSLNRYYPHERTAFDVALDLFLDNPVLFFHHQDLFYSGMDAFSPTARMVNKVQPNVKWRGLGEVSSSLFLQKKQDETDWDINMMSPAVILSNDSHVQMSYAIKKYEPTNDAIDSITINSEKITAERDEEFLEFQVKLAPKSSATIIISYKNHSDLSAIDVSRVDKRVHYLRKISDIRDLVLSRNVIGRKIIAYYYADNQSKKELIIAITLFLLLIVVAGALAMYLGKRRRRKHRR